MSFKDNLVDSIKNAFNQRFKIANERKELIQSFRDEAEKSFETIKNQIPENCKEAIFRGEIFARIQYLDDFFDKSINVVYNDSEAGLHKSGDINFLFEQEKRCIENSLLMNETIFPFLKKKYINACTSLKLTSFLSSENIPYCLQYIFDGDGRSSSNVLVIDIREIYSKMNN